MECFTAEFAFSLYGWALTIKLKHFRDFLEIHQFRKILGS